MKSNLEHQYLLDQHSRKMRKLRVSLLDACNFRCFYCMPLKPRFAAASSYLSPQEIFNICRYLVTLGLEEIRVTGGEPTIRNDFSEIMKLLGQLPVKKLGITTNGTRLKEYLPLLKEVNCRHVNVSLDSLQEDVFAKITRSDLFSTVYESVFAAKEMGFHVKINTVLFKGINDQEILDFVHYADKYGIEVRFLELMKIGQAVGGQDRMFLSAKEALESIRQTTKLTPVHVEADSTSFDFLTPKGGRIGFIASESQPFCGSCSRLRLSFDGYLRACLMSEDGESLRGVPEEDYPAVMARVMGQKPIQRISQISQDMYQIGG